MRNLRVNATFFFTIRNTRRKLVMKKISLVLILLYLQTQVHAYWAGCEDVYMEYELTAGYRLDSLGSRSKFYDDNTCLLRKNHLTIKDINIFEIGAKLRWELYDSFLFKASVAGGITNHGKYEQCGKDELTNEGRFDLHVKKGNSRDASAAIGYMFEPVCGLEVIPLIGLGYDFLSVSMRDNHCFSAGSANLNRISYTSKWTGPWIGLDARYNYNCFQFETGYEYHWANWHGNWKAPKRSRREISFSDIRQSNNANGNVGYLKFGWNINSCFYAGVEVKYQYWKANGGDEHRKRHHSSTNSLTDSDSDGRVLNNDLLSGFDNVFVGEFGEFDNEFGGGNGNFSDFSGDFSSDFSSNSNSSSSSSSTSSLLSEEVIVAGKSPKSDSSGSTNIGKLKSADWQSFSVTLVIRNFF